jgi:hypothetical protein
MYGEAPLRPWDAKISDDFDFNFDVVKVFEKDLL